MTIKQLEADFAAALQCRTRFITTRLVALGHFNVCGRCGGSGHYSYCQRYGTTCFGCSGSGKSAVKLTAKLLATVVDEVAAGGLDAYLGRLKARAAAKKTTAEFSAKWGELHSVKSSKEGEKGSWMNASSRCNAANHFASALSIALHRVVRLATERTHYDYTAKKYIVTEDEARDLAAIDAAAIVRALDYVEDAIPAELSHETPSEFPNKEDYRKDVLDPILNSLFERIGVESNSDYRARVRREKAAAKA